MGGTANRPRRRHARPVPRAARSHRRRPDRRLPAVVSNRRPARRAGRAGGGARAGRPAPAPAELIRAVEAALEELMGASALPPLEARTASDFPGSGLTDEQVRSALRDVPDVTDCYGLAPTQEGLLVRSLYWPESDAYHN